jgi:CheY-like chemotaxis protein
MTARVLVVDDILPNVKLLEAKLSNEYYDVITATSGAEAIEKAEAQSPDIILLDVMMPGMDGFETCQRIKNNPATSHIPVVMVTALTDATDRVRGLESGAQGQAWSVDLGVSHREAHGFANRRRPFGDFLTQHVGADDEVAAVPEVTL